jgi:hypothetical protein
MGYQNNLGHVPDYAASIEEVCHEPGMCLCGARRSYIVFQHNVSSKTSKLASGLPRLNAKNELSRDRSAMC